MHWEGWLEGEGSLRSLQKMALKLWCFPEVANKCASRNFANQCERWAGGRGVDDERKLMAGKFLFNLFAEIDLEEVRFAEGK